MYKLLPAFFVCLAILASCDREPPPPPAPEAPPPPTTEEIVSSLSGAIQALSSPAQGAPDIPIEVKNEAVSSVNQMRGRYGPTENGREAFEQFSRRLDGLIGGARENEAWVALKGLIQSYNALNPGSERYAHIEQRADTMIAMPIVNVRGFMTTNDVHNVNVEVFDRRAPGRSDSYWVREGEEFHDQEVEGRQRPVLRLLRIIGRNQAVEFEYLPVQHTWTVEGTRQIF